MKERVERQEHLDLFDMTFLRLGEGADVVFGTIKDTVIAVDRWQEIKKGGDGYAKT